MGNLQSKTSASVSPFIRKAGLPLILSVAGVTCVTFMSRKYAMAAIGKMIDSLEVKKHVITTSQFLKSVEISNFNDDNEANNEEDVSSVISRIEELEKTECDGSNLRAGQVISPNLKPEQIYMENQFLPCQVIKENESLLMEIKNMLCLESNRVEVLNREVTGMRAEKQICIEQLEFTKAKNVLLQRKVKKLLRKTRELQTRNHVISKLENEVAELQTIVNSLQEEKCELLTKLNSAEISASLCTKIEAEHVSMEDYNRLVNELQQLYKDREAETKELICLRWSNACLRHELMRSYHQQLQQQMENNNKNHLEPRPDGQVGDPSTKKKHQNSVSGLVESKTEAASKADSKRKKLFRKIKNWVEGSSDNVKSYFDDKETNESIAFEGFLFR